MPFARGLRTTMLAATVRSIVERHIGRLQTEAEPCTKYAWKVVPLERGDIRVQVWSTVHTEDGQTRTIDPVLTASLQESLTRVLSHRDLRVEAVRDQHEIQTGLTIRRP